MAINLNNSLTKRVADGLYLSGSGTNNYFALWNGTTALDAAVWVQSSGAASTGLMYAGANPAEIFGGTADSDDLRIWANDGGVTKSPYILLTGENGLDIWAVTDINAFYGAGQKFIFWGNSVNVAEMDASGNLQLDGNIDIDGGAITCPADLDISPSGGDVVFNAYLHIKNGNRLEFHDVGDSHAVSFAAPALTEDTDYILPAADSTGTQAFVSDGSGNMGFSDLGATGSGTDERIVRWSTGNTLQDSGCIIDDSDNMTIAGDLDIDGGDITCPDDLTITPTGGDVLVAANVWLNSGYELRLRDVGNSNYVGFEAPALTADQIWVLPDADGNADEVLTTDGGGNLSFTDKSPKYIYIKATGESEGDLHLSDSNWAVSKALVKTVRVAATSTNWDLYILQNDNGFAANDANIPMLQIMEAGNGDANIYLNLPFEDEDASSEVHLYYLDNAGADTADIYVLGYKLR